VSRATRHGRGYDDSPADAAGLQLSGFCGSKADRSGVRHARGAVAGEPRGLRLVLLPRLDGRGTLSRGPLVQRVLPRQRFDPRLRQLQIAALDRRQTAPAPRATQPAAYCTDSGSNSVMISPFPSFLRLNDGRHDLQRRMLEQRSPCPPIGFVHLLHGPRDHLGGRAPVPPTVVESGELVDLRLRQLANHAGTSINPDSARNVVVRATQPNGSLRHAFHSRARRSKS
jgi:hypothetical protein